MAKASKGVNYNAPGRAHREGVTLVELAERFPTEEAAREWFEAVIWPNGERCCTRCGSLDTVEAKHPSMPYRCRDCKRYFSAKMGTALEGSKVTYKQWVYAIYLSLTNLKGVSSLKIRRDLGVSQPTAWFMMHRLREAWGYAAEESEGPIEVDESKFGGRLPNMHNAKRKVVDRNANKTIVVGVKDRATNRIRAKVIERRDAATLIPFVNANRKPGAVVYTDDWKSYTGLEDHVVVKHGARQYVDGMAHTNGMESFWGMMKRGYHGVYHYMSPKHLQRYADEYAGRHNLRDKDTIEQMRDVIAGLIGRRLLWRDLTAKEAA